MKNFKYATLFLLLFPFVSYGQQLIGAAPKMNTQESNQTILDRAQTNLYIDYSYLNGDSYSTRWSINSYYKPQDSAVSFIGVAIDQLAGYSSWTDYANTIAYPADLGFSSNYPNDAVINIDTVLAFVAHENNSGIADTLIIQLRELNANNSISNTVLWADSMILTTGLSPNNSWSDGLSSFSFLRFPVDFTTTPGQKVGVVLRYLNYNKLDTFGIAAGFVPFSIGAQSAIQSSFKNSFFKYEPFTVGVIKNSDFLMVSGGYLPGQNWVLLSHGTVFNTTQGLLSAKGDLKVFSVYPNPAKESITIQFAAIENKPFTIRVYNALGAQVSEMHTTSASSSQATETIDCSLFATGLYTIAIESNGKTYSQRVVVQK